MTTSAALSVFISILLLGRSLAQHQHQNRVVARQPSPIANQPAQPSAVANQPLQPVASNNRPAVNTQPAENCPPSRVTQCLGHLMLLNITAVIETFKVYELLSFTDIDEGKLRHQAQITTETCRVFNQFNECTGGDFLKCMDKKKLVDIIQGFSQISQSRSGSGGSASSMMNEIAGLITDKQIDVVGRAMIDACRRIQRGEVKLAELALCIRRDRKLLDQLASIAPLPSTTVATATSASQYPISFGQHCRVFRCDVSRLLVHMLVRAAQNCSDESGAKFIFWVGQVSLSGVRSAAPEDVVIANGEFGTQTQSERSDQCVIRDTDFTAMKIKPAKAFAEVGITRASQLCATEVATTTKATTTRVFSYDVAPRPSNKLAIEATIDNDEFWENAASLSTSSSFYSLILAFTIIVFIFN